MSHVFISYVREDNETIQWLCKSLKVYGIEIWLDRDQFKPGYRWADAIREAIREGAFYSACFSSAYHKRSKTYMNEELTLAIEELRQRPTNRAWFIPVLLDNCEVPDRNIGAGESLRSLQWVKLRDNWDEGISQILSVIQPNSARVHELIQALGDKSARVRIKAADDLGLLGGLSDVAIPALIRALDDENETVSAAAAAALGGIGKATESVIARLRANIYRKNSPYAHTHAISALTKLGSSGIAALIQEVEDVYNDTAVISALCGIGKPTVVLLLEMLASRSIEDSIVYDILSGVHDPDAIPELTEALHHKKLWVRIAAAKALADMREHYLSESETTNSIFLEVLSALTEGVQSSDHRVCYIAISSLGKIGELASKSVPTLIEDINDPKLRHEAVKALGRIGSGNQVAIAALVKALEDSDADVRKQAAIALYEIDEPIDIVVPALIKALEDPYAGVCIHAIWALRKRGYYSKSP